jgi:hypothetical protein
MEIQKLEKKKISETVPVQTIIPRPLYAYLVKHCAELDLTIKDMIKGLIEDWARQDKFLYREWKMSDEQYHKAMSALEVYTTILDEVESLQKEKVKKNETK